MAAEQEMFDYELSKTKFMAQVRKYFDEDSTHSANTIKKTIDILKGPVKTQLHKYYELSSDNGRDVLTEKKKTPEDPEIQVLSFEDVFDIFIKYHVENNHEGGRQYLLNVEKQLKTVYNYPTVCLSLLVKSCNVCNLKLPNPATATRIGSVYVTVMIQNKKQPAFKYLLIYIDKTTDFIIIRPLRQKSFIEIAMEIYKILMQFGSPQKLCLHGYDKALNMQVEIILKQLCPMFNLSIEYRSTNYDPSAYVVDKLQKWMIKRASMSWEIGCMVIQKELNMDIKLESCQNEKKLSSFELLYGKTRKRIKNNYEHVFEMRFKSDKLTKDVSLDSAKNKRVYGVVKRIPSTENNNQDLNSQLEHEASQNQDTVVEEVEDPVLDPVKAVVVSLYNENEIEQPEVVLPLDLDLEVDDDTPDPEDNEDDEDNEDKRRSLRISKRKYDKATEWIKERDEMVFSVDDVCDPLDTADSKDT